MAVTEKSIADLEFEFPRLADNAFALAREETLAMGDSVLQVAGDSMFRVYPNGVREFVKHVAPPLVVEPGTIVELR